MMKCMVINAMSRIAVVVATVSVSQAPAGVVFSGPIVITSGGTYSGNWQSNNPNVPAVLIRTTSPVIIDNSNIQSKGDLIETDVAGVNLTVQNSSGYGLNPGVAGLSPGRFLDAESFNNIVVKNNYLQNTAGIELMSYNGNHTTNKTVQILNNQVLNIDGRISNGAGGWLNYNERTPISGGPTQAGFNTACFVQLSRVQHVPGIVIAWNRVINQPGNSRVEDNINIWESSGTSSSPILIHDNYIQGAYTIKPWQGNTSDGTYNYDWGYSGGGINLGDGDTQNPAQASSFVQAYQNQVVSTTNYGIEIGGGHDISFNNNRIVSSGLLADGRAITNQNVGACIWDCYHVGSSSCYNNSGQGNTIGWNGTSDRSDWWVPGASSWKNNVHMAGPITLATEAAELAFWKNKLATNHVTIGP